MTERVPDTLRQVVRDRAGRACEYCLIHEDDCFLPHEIDHIISVKHRGPNTAENLAWSCFTCNRHKGSDIASNDPKDNDLARLFNPRSDVWSEHFDLRTDGLIKPLTATGRVTEYLLYLNSAEQIEVRRLLNRLPRSPR